MRVTIRPTDGSPEIFEDIEGVFSVQDLERTSLTGRSRVLFFNPAAVRSVLIDKSPVDAAKAHS